MGIEQILNVQFKLNYLCITTRASLVALVVKNLPANAGDTRDTSLIPGLEDPLK